MPNKVWNDITYPFPNFNSCTLKFWGWVGLWGFLWWAPSAKGKDPGWVLPMWWVIHMCRGFDPLFSLWQDRARSFWGIFSHPSTPKRSFGVLKLPILTEFDLLGPKFNFSLDLFGSKFQRPAAHPHQFSDRVPPPGGKTTTGSALDGAVFDIAQILAYLVHNMSRSQLYLGFGQFGWLPSFFGQ